MDNTTMDTDFIIVGGSFAGLAAAVQLARTNRRVRVIDAGMPRNRYAAAAHGFLGHDGRAPGVIMEDGRRQLLAYPSASIVSDFALKAERIDGGFAVDLDEGGRLTCKRLILATGVVDQLPDIAGLRERWGVSVLHCPYCHGYEYSGQRLAVIGLHPVSAHVAQLIADWSTDVTYFVNGMPLEQEQADALARRGVKIEHSPVAAFAGPAPAMEAVVLADGRAVSIDAAFIATELTPGSPLAHQLGCEFDEGPLGQYVRTNQFQETTVAGVYAAGDMARQPHNATWAASDGVSAGVFAHQSLVFA